MPRGPPSSGKGVLLSTSSMVSISGQASGVAYPASKFAVNGLTISLARELGPKGIRVNAVAPGFCFACKAYTMQGALCGFCLDGAGKACYIHLRRETEKEPF